ncbi:MAG: four helix bundle protein [Proteobacteria bacterium]|nr:four helix bundle protein [Pseudomonadota bacterium]
MNHEKLDCFRQLMALAEDLAKRVAKWPRGNGFLADQLNRAMSSAVLNLAEGNGKRAYGRERRRFFQIALGSLAETSAALDLARAFGLMPAVQQEALKSRLKLAYVKIEALP